MKAIVAVKITGAHDTGARCILIEGGRVPFIDPVRGLYLTRDEAVALAEDLRRAIGIVADLQPAPDSEEVF